MRNSSSAKMSLYWLCQLLGWGTAALYWCWYQLIGDFPLWLGILSVLVSFLVGIGSTHAYKVMAHRQGWIRLNLRELFPRMLLALITLTSIYLLTSYLTLIMRICGMDTDTFLGMLTGGVRYMAIWLLAFHLYHYARHSRQAEIDQTQFEKLALAAQFNQLHAELNPHFLFNSLNSIKALTLENPQAARAAVDLLSDMLRSSLQYSNKAVIPLQEELKRITAYLALEKIRFEERLKYTVDIQAETKEINIPPLSLYNLVENAVKHGINKSKAGGHIHISSYIDQGKVHFEVINDGILEENPNGGVGLKNVAARIKLLYGAMASLSLEAMSHNQVVSKMSLPISR